MRLNMWVPIAFWSILSLFIASLIILSATEIKGTRFFFGFVPLLLPVAIILHYLRSLKFVKVETPFHLAENLRIVEDFLQANHLLVFRHPEAPEVLQIVSRSVSVGKDEREMIFFIADDYRVLVNSRFTYSGWSLSQEKSHINQMCGSLQRFIKNKYSSNPHGLQRNF